MRKDIFEIIFMENKENGKLITLKLLDNTTVILEQLRGILNPEKNSQ